VGREARCSASWGTRSGAVTVHLDATELTVRGAFRASAPLASLRDLRADGDALRFRTAEDEVALILGPAAPRWAAAIAKPPLTLAAKLGIGAETRVLTVGAIDDDALARALAAGIASERDPDVIVARVDDPGELARAVSDHRALLESRVPLWVVYTKGRRAPLGETAVRAMLREQGLIDLKVASVSATLTALQFARRQSR
jgi:hypothetical protein